MRVRKSKLGRLQIETRASANSEFYYYASKMMPIWRVYYYASKICAPGDLVVRPQIAAHILSTIPKKICPNSGARTQRE